MSIKAIPGNAARLVSYLAVALFSVSCAGPTTVDFRVNSINTEEEEIPCVVLRDEQVVVDDKTNRPLLTPAQVPVTFSPDTTGSGPYQSVKLGVRAVRVDEEGNVVEGLAEGDSSPYVEDSRFVYDNDARMQLFVLRRNKGL